MKKYNVNANEIDNFFKNISRYSHNLHCSFYNEGSFYLAYNDYTSNTAKIIKLTKDNFNDIISEHTFIASFLGFDYVLPEKISEDISKMALFKKSGISDSAPLRLTGYEGIFEGLVQIIIGQQISVAAANTIRMNLIKSFGTKISYKDEATLHAFPSAAIINSLKSHQLADIGLSVMKRKCIKELSDFYLKNNSEIKKIMEGKSDLIALRKTLKNIHGIGDWTLDWFELKIIRNFNRIPTSDFAVKKSYQWALDTEEIPTREEIERYSAKVKPYSGILCHNLLYSYQNYARSLKK